MSEFNVITYYGKKVMTIEPFNDFLSASQYMSDQKKSTRRLRFYLVKTMAYSNSEGEK